MKIIQSKQLKPGDIIDWQMVINDEVTTFNYSRSALNRKYKLQCVQAFSHHVLFKMLEHPYHKVDIQNVDLWKKGIYKQQDILNQFVTKGKFGE